MAEGAHHQDFIPGSSSTWTIDGNTISGSVVLSTHTSDAVVADFEVTCI